MNISTNFLNRIRAVHKKDTHWPTTKIQDTAIPIWVSHPEVQNISTPLPLLSIQKNSRALPYP